MAVKRYAAALLFASILGVHTSASSSLATWSLGPVTFEVVPFAVGAALIWDDGGSGSIGARAQQDPGPPDQQTGTFGDWSTASGAVTATSPASSAMQAVSGGPVFNGTASATSLNPLQASVALVEADASRTFTTTGALMLLAYAPYSISAIAGPEPDGYAFAAVALAGFFTGASGGPGNMQTDWRQVSSGCGCGGPSSDSGIFELSLTMNEPGTGVFGAVGFAEAGQAAVAPVPEPSTWALMIAGLAVIGFVGRSKGRQALTAA
jgi:hypothetical protein